MTYFLGEVRFHEASDMSSPYSENSAYWDAAYEHYHWDRLADAFGLISEWGIGDAGENLKWYRIIEAEHITRQNSTIAKVNDWLSFEYLPREIHSLASELITRILAACDEVGRRLDWQHQDQVLISILAEVTDAPWSTHPYGYCVQKEEYEKICLPNYLVDDPEEFAQAVAHEYAHVVSESMADGYAPRWLEEAISVLVEARFDEDTSRKFAEGDIPWLSPGDLELAIEGRSDEAKQAESVWRAYQQAGWIGRYLAESQDEVRLSDLLRKIADESPRWNIARTLRGKSRLDYALIAVYSFDTPSLFWRSFEHLKSTIAETSVFARPTLATELGKPFRPNQS